MSKNRELKEQAVAEIVEKFRGAQSVVFASYSGLTVEQVTALRKQCRENDVQYCVLKNRLVKLAMHELGIEGADDLLNGPNAFVFGMKDAVAAPKIISEFIDKNKLTSLKITGGVLEGQVEDTATIDKLAKMPSREVLLARLVGSMNATIGNFVRVVEAIRKQKAGEE
ncbi:MAG: 50S ribosomal protein L10 [Clostridia bacterium]|nr:50S ribosomal protein L10 [Clostridia bacterium]